jgi:murein DD-endopeptidase MepM/ murein hydrolase activator NlpD
MGDARKMGRALTRLPGTRRARLLATASVFAVLLVGSLAVGTDGPAWASRVDYPSWGDVTAARKSEAATKAKIAEIQALIARLQAEVDRTQADMEAKGDIAYKADAKFQEAAVKADKLQGQADEAEATAKQSISRAGEMVAQMYRAGNGDVTTTLFVNASQADDLLYSYGMADKFAEQTASVYELALQDQKSAQSLTDQANVAKKIREQLKAEADAALEVATQAAAAAQAAQAEQEEYQNQLQAQLAVLTQRRQATEADYLAGVRARIAASAQLGAGEISPSGWARPSGGRITSGFGYRADPYGGGGTTFHMGTDLGAGCGAPIYAAHSGTVVYAGWKGIYGNYIQVNNGDGIQTVYGHIQNGGILVHMGQDVGVGSQIAKVGATGGATGCHLHYGVLVNGVVTDPVPFMRNQGITLG